MLDKFQGEEGESEDKEDHIPPGEEGVAEVGGQHPARRDLKDEDRGAREEDAGVEVGRFLSPRPLPGRGGGRSLGHPDLQEESQPAL